MKGAIGDSGLSETKRQFQARKNPYLTRVVQI